MLKDMPLGILEVIPKARQDLETEVAADQPVRK
jgi:hypothetical protein